MSEFVHRIDSLTAERAIPAVRPVAAVAPVHQGSGLPAESSRGEAGADTGAEARREHMASAFDYARVQARIADILSELDAGGTPSADASSTAIRNIEALRPEPVVIIPMPPASREAIEHAVAVARAMAEKAALTRSAQANVALGAVNQMMAANA